MNRTGSREPRVTPKLVEQFSNDALFATAFPGTNPKGDAPMRHKAHTADKSGNQRASATRDAKVAQRAAERLTRRVSLAERDRAIAEANIEFGIGQDWG